MRRFERCKAIALVDEDGTPLALLRDPEFFHMSKSERAALTSGTADSFHSGAADIFSAAGDWMLGGDLEVIDRVGRMNAR